MNKNLNFEILGALTKSGALITLTAIIDIGTELINMHILGNSNYKNYYILALYLPLSYILSAILESCRASMLFISASLYKEHKHLIGSQIILMIGFGFILLFALWLLFEIFFLPITTFLKINLLEQGTFKLFTELMLALSYVSYISYTLMSVLYGCGKVRLVVLFAGVSGLFSIMLTFLSVKFITTSIYTLVYSMTISSLIVGIITFIILTQENIFIEITIKKIILSVQPFINQILQIALPIFISYLIIFLSLFIFNTIVSNFGEDIVSGFGVAYRIQTLVILPAISLGIATGILINQRKSELDHIQIDSIFRTSILCSILLYFTISVFIFYFRNQCVLLIVSTSTIHNHAVQYFDFVALSYLGFGPFLVFITTMEQIGLGLRGLLLNCIYFSIIIVIGGVLAIKLDSIVYLYKIIALINMISFALICYLCFIRKQQIIHVANFITDRT